MPIIVNIFDISLIINSFLDTVNSQSANTALNEVIDIKVSLETLQRNYDFDYANSLLSYEVHIIM